MFAVHQLKYHSSASTLPLKSHRNLHQAWYTLPATKVFLRLCLECLSGDTGRLVDEACVGVTVSSLSLHPISEACRPLEYTMLGDYVAIHALRRW